MQRHFLPWIALAAAACVVATGCTHKQSSWPADEAAKIKRALLWSPPPPAIEPVRPPGYEPKPPSRYDDLLRHELREGEELAIEMISLAIKYDDDLPRQLGNAAREIGADPATAARNIDAIRRVATQRREELQRSAAISPILNQQLTDPEFAELAYEGSRAPLSSIPPLERIARHWNCLLFAR